MEKVYFSPDRVCMSSLFNVTVYFCFIRCVCACVRACVRACVHACVRACMRDGETESYCCVFVLCCVVLCVYETEMSGSNCIFREDSTDVVPDVLFPDLLSGS